MSDASGSRRLPTRCPACKGAMIERMPSAAHGTFMWFHCLFCHHAWKFRVEDPRENANGELTGDLFIVTRRRTKERLGAIAVNAIPEDALKKHLESKTLHGERESRKLQLAIAGLTATLKIAQAEDDRLWKILQRDEHNLRHARAWSSAFHKTEEISKQIKELQARRQHLTSGEYFFESLPSPISSAKTNADGKFTLTLPRQGRYGVVAKASRELFKKKETYFWIVWVSLGGEPSKRLTLSNDNMMGAGSQDSALR
jgi:hypothetical protein